VTRTIFLGETERTARLKSGADKVIQMVCPGRAEIFALPPFLELLELLPLAADR
jgi:hypothetical protein